MDAYHRTLESFEGVKWNAPWIWPSELTEVPDSAIERLRTLIRGDFSLDKALSGPSSETDFILTQKTGAALAISLWSIRALRGPAQRLSLVGILLAARSAATDTAQLFSPSRRAAAEPL
jgi:hypothetical protein